MKTILYILGDIVHNLQRERGCISMFLCSEGKIFLDRMNNQFAKSDEIFEIFFKNIDRWEKSENLKQTQLNKLKILLNLCEELPELRKKILIQKISVSQIIDFYAHKLIGQFLQIMVEIALYTEEHNPIFVSAYNAFLQWKERIGLERSIGARGFIKHSFHNSEFLERILFLFSEQGNFCNIYMALANIKQKQLVQEMLEGIICTRLEYLHNTLKESSQSVELYNLTPEEWFDLITAKIDILHNIENKLIDTLNSKNIAIDNNVTKDGNQIIGNYLSKYNNLINSLQLFSKLNINDLNSILCHGQIKEFSKGKLLFMEGEKANRLYIILEGWVKIFKGTPSGEEAIIQMLSSGDSIIESSIFLNIPFPVNAQIAEDAILLSLPASIIREQIKNNSELALNLLATMSYRSQGLIRQIEDTRLKSVDERIGLFLLQLLLEQGFTSRHIKLPYDKSLIASYLDMKRETFSRSLKRLKAKGFKIENDIITIPDIKSLCNFCNSDAENNCSFNDTKDCQNFNLNKSQTGYS